jgi:hypothetical protein
MHHLKFNTKTLKDTKFATTGFYSNVAILHENDLQNAAKVVHSKMFDLIIIPRTYSLTQNPNVKTILQLALTPNGQIKRY